MWCFLVIGTFSIIKISVSIGNFIICKFVVQGNIMENVDKLPTTTSLLYMGIYCYALGESFRLPTSHGMRPGFRRRYQLSYHHENSPQLINSYIRHYIFIIMITFLSAIWLGLSMLSISNDHTLEKISEKIAIYPSEISNARFNFLLLSCVTIPIGFILSNVFSKLYLNVAVFLFWILE